MHNMIVEYKQDEYDANFDYLYDPSNDVSTSEVLNRYHESFRRYLERRAHMHKKEIHYHLQVDLVEHI